MSKINLMGKRNMENQNLQTLPLTEQKIGFALLGLSFCMYGESLN